MRHAVKSRSAIGLKRLTVLVYLATSFFALSWAKDFLLPIILAILISFLLAPVVTRLEKFGLHPVLAILSTVAIAFAVIGAIFATVLVQTVDLMNALPKYRQNIEAKWTSIQKGPPGPVNLAFRNVGELVNDLGKITTSAGRSQEPEPAKVQVVNGGDRLFSLLKAGMAPIAGPTDEFFVVAVLVVFMLVERKRLRQRFLGLVGPSQIATTTLAVDEAGSRLSSFLLAQLQVNSGFALVLGIGLYVIGIPNAVLWAVLTLLLRFLPYIGVWISAVFTLALSFAISTTWKEPMMVAALYIVLELFTNNVVEPFALGSSAGMSPVAVIISALFWTWLWGPVGLLLATPLSACLVALGRYFPALYPWSVLFAAQPPASSERKLVLLLTEARMLEAKALMHELTGMQLSARAAEELIIPCIRAIENDPLSGPNPIQTKSRLYGQMRELVEELTIPTRRAITEQSPGSGQQFAELVIVPFIGEGDELVGVILERLLGAEGITSIVLPWRMLRVEKLQRLQELHAKCVVISAIEARSVFSVGKMARSIRSLLQDAAIVIGLWSLPREGSARLVKKISESQACNVCTNLDQAIQGVVSIIAPARSVKEAARE
jgi:predicted PurR-regulated permease PerM